MTKGACPYSKGEQETHYDSEDEEESAADVPKSHHGGKQPPQATLAGEAISTDTDGKSCRSSDYAGESDSEMTTITRAVWSRKDESRLLYSD